MNDEWYKAPIPRQWHRCKPVTTGYVDGRTVERCSCGAIRVDQEGWFERNSRRKRTT